MLLLMGVTAFSKLTGMLRSVIFAAKCGAGSFASAFAVANRIPTALFDLFLGSAISGCFIPVYTAQKKNRADFAASFLTAVTLISGILALFGSLFSDKLILTAFPGLSSDTRELAAKLLRLFFPAMVSVGAAYVLIFFLRRRALSPILLFSQPFFSSTVLIPKRNSI